MLFFSTILTIFTIYAFYIKLRSDTDHYLEHIFISGLDSVFCEVRIQICW